MNAADGQTPRVRRGRIIREDGPDPIDMHVGRRIRRRRRMLRLSQATLAEQLGKTFQAIQKYETGENRISASTLWRLALVLEMPVTYFFDGLGDNIMAELAQSSAEGKALQAVKPLAALSPEIRDLLLRLVRLFACDVAANSSDS